MNLERKMKRLLFVSLMLGALSGCYYGAYGTYGYGSPCAMMGNNPRCVTYRYRVKYCPYDHAIGYGYRTCQFGHDTRIYNQYPGYNYYPRSHPGYVVYTGQSQNPYLTPEQRQEILIRIQVETK